jgi:hypothetical protein
LPLIGGHNGIAVITKTRQKQLRLFKYLQIGERVNKNDQDTKNTNNTK